MPGTRRICNHKGKRSSPDTLKHLRPRHPNPLYHGAANLLHALPRPQQDPISPPDHDPLACIGTLDSAGRTRGMCGNILDDYAPSSPGDLSRVF
jgi:hypothetical protein